MGESTLYIDEAYSILLGRDPDTGTSPRARREAVMEHWKSDTFKGDKLRETIAKLALCQIGLAWHPSDSYPYQFESITKRLLEFMPELETAYIGARTMRDILGGRHPSQYGQRLAPKKNE